MPPVGGYPGRVYYPSCDGAVHRKRKLILVATKQRSTSYAADKADILKSLNRIEGQVRGVARMVEEDQYCVDVLTQLSAIMSAARRVGLLVLEDHIRGCVLNGAHGDQEALVAELSEAIERFTRAAK